MWKILLLKISDILWPEPQLQALVFIWRYGEGTDGPDYRCPGRGIAWDTNL